MANAHRAPVEGHGAGAMVVGNDHAYSANLTTDQDRSLPDLPPFLRRAAR